MLITSPGPLGTDGTPLPVSVEASQKSFLGKLSMAPTCYIEAEQCLTGGQVELHDGLVGHVVEVLDDAAEGVSVGSDQDLLSGQDLRHDGVVPVGQGSLDGQLKGLEHRELLGLGLLSISGVFDDDVVVRVVRVHRRWGDVEGTAPDLEGFLSAVVFRT